jgi:hypothetical protein
MEFNDDKPQEKQNWESDAFINLTMAARTASGERKIGVIKLKESNKFDKQLIDFCELHEDNAQKVVDQLVGTYNRADTSVEEAGFVLPESASEEICDSLGLGDDTAAEG